MGGSSSTVSKGVYLENGNLDKFSKVLSEQWDNKIMRSPETINRRIAYLYKIGLKNGAIGGKLIGAGGGGFLLFYAHNKKKLLNLWKNINLFNP